MLHMHGLVINSIIILYDYPTTHIADGKETGSYETTPKVNGRTVFHKSDFLSVD